MSEISLFTAVKYNNYCQNAPVRGSLARRLDNWTFPLFGSKVEVIEFGNVARFQQVATKSNLISVAFRILLLVTIIFPVVVLIARAIIRRGIEFKKIETPKTSPPKPEVPSLRAIHSHKENQVPVGKPFSIALRHSWTTGHQPWKMTQIPSFINHRGGYVKSDNQPSGPDFCGGGNDNVFVFEPKQSGRGKIVMQMPGFDPSRTIKKKFTIVAV